MVRDAFSHVDTWVFDLDNTLYPPEAALFDLIEVRMTAWVMDALGVDQAQADHLRLHYWRKHGTTLAGLMREHGVDPDRYLDDVHDIPSWPRALPPCPDAASSIPTAAPPTRAVCWPRVDWTASWTRFMAWSNGVTPARAAMFEDEPRNLAVPHALGMRTVHVAPAPLDPARPDVAHIQYHTDDLSGFLAQLQD